jgi:hypothetical protein
MVIKTILFGFLGLIAGISSWPAHAFGEKSLFIGNIVFPGTLEMVPSIRIYYAGRKISCENDDYSKKVTFSIPEYKQRTFFFLLITPHIEFASHENTVPFLKLKKGSPYKFFAMELVAQETPKKRKGLGGSETQRTYSWVIKPIDLSGVDGRIPDETIIVRYNPDFVTALEGGSMIEFPKIIINPDIIKFVGSEAKLHEYSNRWFLASLNTDTIHDTAHSEIRMAPQSKTVLAMIT